MKYSNSLKLTLLYVLVGLIWIYLSDAVVTALFPSEEQQQFYQPIKRLIYVVSTATFLYILLTRFNKVQSIKNDALRKNEHILRESETRYKLLFNESPLAKFVVGAQTGVVIEANEKASLMSGFPLTQIVGHNISEILSKQELIAEMASNAGPVIITHKRPDERTLQIELSTLAFKFKGTNCMLLLCSDVTAREETLQNLNKTQQKLSAAQKIARIGYWQYEITTGQMFWSDEVYDIWGVDKGVAPLTYDFFLRSIHPGDRHYFPGSVPELKGFTEYDIVHRILLPDGTQKWVHGIGSCRTDKEGTPLYLEGTAQDITGQKELELLLTKATTLAKIGGWEIDVVNDQIQWSSMTRQIHGIGDNTFNPTFEEAVAFYKEGLHRDRIVQMVTDAIQNGTKWDIESVIVTRQNELKWVRSVGEPEFFNGKCIRIVGSFQDIDNIKKAELGVVEALKDKETVLERIGDAFIAVDTDWVVTYWNSKAEQVLGRKREEVIGRDLWTSYADAIDTPFYTNYHEALATGELRSFQAYYEGTGSWFEVSAFPSDTGLSIFFRDVTEVRNYIDTIEHNNRALKEIAWSQSHEVRAPLARILGLLSLIHDLKLSPPPDLAEMLEMLETSANDLDSVIRKIDSKTNSK